MEKYQVEFSGMKLGSHAFDFDLEESFFEHFGFSDISGSRVKVHADMEREERMLVFRFRISGTVVVPCDRCGDPLELAIGGDQRLVVKLGDHSEEESEDVQIVRESEGKFDLSQFIYEYVRLMLPAHPVHGEGPGGKSLCNPAVLAKLEELKKSHAPDPRWEVLNKLREQ